MIFLSYLARKLSYFQIVGLCKELNVWYRINFPAVVLEYSLENSLNCVSAYKLLYKNRPTSNRIFRKPLQIKHNLSWWNSGIMKRIWGAGIACWLERWTHDRKVASSNPGRSGGRIFFSRVNFLCWLLLGVRSTPVLPQWHVKDLGHSAKSADGRLHLNTHTSLTKQSRSGLTILHTHSMGT